MTTINPSLVPLSFFQKESPTVLAVDRTFAETVQAGVQAKLDKLPPIGDETFLKQVANLAPGEIDTPDELKSTLDRLEAASAKLAELGSGSGFVFTGDVAKFLARAMIEFAGQQRQQAADDRLMAREAAKAELLGQAAEMKEAAVKMMAGAVTNLVIGVVGSAVALYGASKSLKGQVGEMKNMTQAAKDSAAASKTLDSLGENAGAASKTTGVGKTTKGVDIDVKVDIGVTRARSNAFSKPDFAADGTAIKPGTGTPGLKSDPSMLANSDDAVAKGNRPRSNAVTERPESGPATPESVAANARASKDRADKAFTLAEKEAGIHMTRGQAYEAIGTLMKSIGGGIDGSLQASAKYDEAEGQIDAAMSQYFQQVADGKKDIEDSMKEMITQVINFVREMQEAEVDAMRSLTKV